MVLCVCDGHQLFGIGYSFKIFRSQVATGKKKLILRPVMNFQFLEKLWCCVGGRDQNKNLVLSND